MLYCKSLGYEKFTSNPTFLQDFTTGFLLGSRYGKILPIKLKLVGMQSKIFYQIFFLSQLGPLQCVWHKKSQIKSKLKFGKYWAGPPIIRRNTQGIPFQPTFERKCKKRNKQAWNYLKCLQSLLWKTEFTAKLH